MPRTYVRRKGKRKRRAAPRWRIRKPVFQDLFPFIQGSVIEKKVMAELVRRGIYFEHTTQMNRIGGGVPAGWEADFSFPQYKIWLEVNGEHWHMLPGVPEADALRYATIEAAGWRVLVWWENDVDTRLQWLFDQVTEFTWVDHAMQEGYRLTPGLPFFEGGAGIDHLKGLRTANRNRRKPVRLRYRVRRSRVRK